jgi:hypothetical protein
MKNKRMEEELMEEKVTIEEAHKSLVEQTGAMDTANACGIGEDCICLYFPDEKADKNCSFKGTEYMGWPVKRVITGGNFALCSC